MSSPTSRAWRPTPLLGQTIGANLAATVARFPDREALVVPFQDVRLTYASSATRSTGSRAGLLGRGLERGDRVGIWSPNSAEWVLVQYATAKIGAILVNINPAYRTHEVEYALEPVGLPDARRRDRLQDERLRAMVDEVRPNLPALERVVFLGTARLGRRCSATPTTVADDALRGAMAARSAATTPINIQYTSGTTGLPEGRHAQPPQHPQQRLLRRRGLRATPRPTGCASPCPSTTASGWCSATSAAPPTARRWWCPAPAFDPAATLETVAGRALHEPLRRPDDVHRRARASRLRPLRPVVSCAPGSWPARRARSR